MEINRYGNLDYGAVTINFLIKNLEVGLQARLLLKELKKNEKSREYKNNKEFIKVIIVKN